MGRYIRKFSKASMALGPSEERGFGLWAGYELVGIDCDLSDRGFIDVTSWSRGQLEPYGIVEFTRVDASNEALLARLGLDDLYAS